MDAEEARRLHQLIASQKKLQREAEAKAGQRRVAFYSRQTLLQQYSRPAQPTRGFENVVPTSIIGNAYLPCQLSLADLQKVLLKDLKLETHERGKFLVARILGHPLQVTAVTNALEDEAGDVDRVAIYNTKHDLRITDVLPQGRVVAIKQPYYRLGNDGRYILRIDHPSDMVVLDEDHPLYSVAWKTHSRTEDNTAVSWKLEGNNALAKKAYLDAHRCYTRGLA